MRVIQPKIEGWNDKTCPSCGKQQKLNIYCNKTCREIGYHKKKLEELYKKIDCSNNLQ